MEKLGAYKVSDAELFLKSVGLLVLTLAIFMLQVSGASACMVAGPSKEQIQDLIDQAYYVGKVKVIEIDKNLVTLEAIQPYKETDVKIMKAYYVGSSCSKGRLLKVGTIYEELVYESNPAIPHHMPDSLYLSERPEYPYKEDWERLRATAPKTDFLQQEIKACQAKGGIWDSETIGWRTRIFDCYFETSDHNQECNDNSQCEGICITKLSQSEQRSLINYQSQIRQYSKKGVPVPFEWSLKKSGRCSKWTKPNGCFNTVSEGAVTPEKCFAAFN